MKFADSLLCCLAVFLIQFKAYKLMPHIKTCDQAGRTAYVGIKYLITEFGIFAQEPAVKFDGLLSGVDFYLICCVSYEVRNIDALGNLIK